MYKFFTFLLFFSSLLYATTLKIASYNVENLFDMQNNGTEYEEYRPHQHNWTETNLQKKLLNIAEVICDVNADIIGLQEIENEHVLKRLKKTLKRVGCLYPYHGITHKKKSAIQVALLSKIPMENVQEIRVGQSLSYRNILEVKFKVDKSIFYVFVNHWSSKRASESKRIFSAKRLLKRLKALKHKSEYIVLGDFNNDYDEHYTVQRTAINHLLKTSNEEGKFYRVETLKYEDFTHYNLWLEQPNYRRWSHNFYGKKQALDSIVLPETLFDGKGLEYEKGSFQVFKKSYLFQKYGYLFRWQYKKNRHLGKGYSDHFPIYANFSTSKPFKKKTPFFPSVSIEALLATKLKSPVVLEKVKVISLKKNKAAISQQGSQQSIYVYGVDSSFKVGETYDLRVYGCKKYQGKYEIIDFEIEKRYDTSTLTKDKR